MGMEDGSNYFDSGGGDVSGGSYDLGGDFVYGYGQGGGDFVIDPGFGLPDNVSPEGDAIAWGFDTTSWPTLDQGGDIGPIADQALMIDPFTGLIDAGNGFGYDPVADQFYDIGGSQGDFSGDPVWRGIYDDWRAFGVDDTTAAQLANEDYQALRESQGVINISTSEQNAPPVLPDSSYYPLPYVPFTYNPWETPPYVPTFPEGPIPPPPGLPPSPASGQPNLPPACAPGTYHPYPIGHPQQNICVPFPAPQTSAPKPPTGTSSTPSKPPAQQQKPTACPTGYARDPVTQQCRPIPGATSCPSGQYYSQRLRRCAPIPRCNPGFIFDPVIEGCVRIGTQTNTLPAPVGGLGQSIEDLFKNTPPWLWAALLAALLLMSGGDERRMTIQHRRAT